MSEDQIKTQATEDQQFMLNVYNSRVDAEIKLWQAKANWNKAVMEIIERQIAATGAMLRLNQLRQALNEYRIAFKHCTRELHLQQRNASILEGSIRSASRLLVGKVGDPGHAWGNFWQILNLAGVSAKIAAAKVMCGEICALEYLSRYKTLDVPAVGSPIWIALSEIFTILDAEASAQLVEVEKRVAQEEAKLADLRKMRWDAVSTVGLKPAT